MKMVWPGVMTGTQKEVNSREVADIRSLEELIENAAA
jgi:hypothetical protein